MEAKHIIQMGLDGIGAAEISERTGVPSTAIVTILSRARKQGIDIPMGRRGGTGHKAADILALVLAGVDRHVIAEQLDTCIASVTAALSQARQRGVQVPRFDGSLEHLRPRILELGAIGVRPADIAVHVGCSARYATVTLSKARRDGATLPRYNGRRKAA